MATVTAQSDTPAYISNPFALLWHSTKLIGTNIQTMFVLIGLYIALIVAFIPGLIVVVAGASLHSVITIVIGVILMLAAVVTLVMYGVRLAAAMYLLYFGNARREEKTFKQFYAEAKPIAWRLAGLSIVVALIEVGGFLLLIVPGFIFAYRYSLAMYAMVDENLTIGQALGRSRELVRAHGWETFGLMGATQLLAALEYVPFGGFIVGIVLSWASGNARAVRYLQLKDLKSEIGTPTPAVNVWNYIAVFAGPILLGIFVAFSIVHDLGK